MRLATTRPECAISVRCGCSKVAIIFGLRASDFPAHFGGKGFIRPTVMASSRKTSERTSAFHHAAGVTNVIPDILVIAKLRLRRNNHVRGRTQGHEGNPDCFAGLLQNPNRHRKSTMRQGAGGLRCYPRRTTVSIRLTRLGACSDFVTTQAHRNFCTNPTSQPVPPLI